MCIYINRVNATKCTYDTHYEDVDMYIVLRGGGAGVETQKNARGEIRGWGRVPFNETYAPSFSTIYDGA